MDALPYFKIFSFENMVDEQFVNAIEAFYSLCLKNLIVFIQPYKVDVLWKRETDPFSPVTQPDHQKMRNGRAIIQRVLTQNYNYCREYRYIKIKNLLSSLNCNYPFLKLSNFGMLLSCKWDVATGLWCWVSGMYLS